MAGWRNRQSYTARETREGPQKDQSGDALEERIAKLIDEIEGSGELKQSE